LLGEGVSFPEDAVVVALDALVVVGEVEAFFGEAAVGGVDFDGEEAAVEFFGDDGGGADAGEGIEDQVAGIGAGEDALSEEFFGFLGGVVGVFGHGPEGDGEVGPEVGGVGDAEAAGGGLLPILGVAVVGVGSEDAAFHFDGVDVEAVVVGFGAEPDVFGVVFPVAAGAAAFFSFPGDAATENEVFFGGELDGGGGAPVAAEVKGGIGFHEADELGQPGFEVVEVGLGGGTGEALTVEGFIEVVGGIGEDEVDAIVRELVGDVEEVGVDGAVDQLVDFSGAVEFKEAFGIAFLFGGGEGKGFVAWGPGW